MAAAAVVLPAPPVASVVSFKWDNGGSVLRLSSFPCCLPALVTGGRCRPLRPSLCLHRELHIHRFLPDGHPWSDEVVILPDCLRNADGLVSPPRGARAAFADMVRAMEEYGGLPDEALQRTMEDLVSYVRDVAMWVMQPGAPPLSMQVCAAVHVSLILEEGQTVLVQYDYGEPLPTAVGMETAGMMDNQLAGGIRAGCTGCGDEEEEEAEGEECCAICLERMPWRERRWLPCSHFFHRDCVGRWLMEKAECPLCRRQVTRPA